MDCRLKIQFIELEISNLIFKIQVQINRELGVCLNKYEGGRKWPVWMSSTLHKLNSHHVMQSCYKITFSRGKIAHCTTFYNRKRNSNVTNGIFSTKKC